MRSNAPLFGILAAIWILAGTWLFSSLICGSSVANAVIPAFSIEDGLFKAGAAESFYFQENFASPNTNDSVDEAFGRISTYLNANESKQLALVGMYDKDEVNNTDYDNLGIGRAEAIKKLLSAVHGADENKILTDGMADDSLIYFGEKLYDGVQFTFLEPTETSTSGELEELDMTPEKLMFSGNSPDLTLTPALQHSFDKLRAFLNENPGSTIRVEGHVASSGSSSTDDSESLKRARKVRRVLRNNGFKSAEVIAVGKGSSSPNVDSDHPDAEMKNNRVVIKVDTKE